MKQLNYPFLKISIRFIKGIESDIAFVSDQHLIKNQVFRYDFNISNINKNLPSVHIEQKTLIEASCTSNIHTGGKGF